MGWIETAARMLGKSPQEVKAAYSKAKKMIGDAPPSIANASKILKENGISGGFIDKAISVVKPIAKAAKFMGVKELKNVDIDDMAAQAQQLTSVQYPSYDRRNVVDKRTISNRADDLPD